MPTHPSVRHAPNPAATDIAASHRPVVAAVSACGSALRVVMAGLLAGALGSMGAAQAACPPAGHTGASLQALKAARWQLPDAGADAARQALAVALLDCLADPDPALRDGVAFEALQHWMRGQQLSAGTLHTVRQRLLAVLAAPADAAGYGQPFAALVLAEVARLDRRQPFLSDEERSALVAQATAYLAGVRDYRGFDTRDGWRHGVAHGADLLLQLSLNPALTPPQAQAMREAIAVQVLPPGEHAYRFGEPERLAAPVFYLARREDGLAGDWFDWFDALLARWPRGAAVTAQSLAQRHNLGAFVTALYVAVQQSPDAAVQARLLPPLRKALRGLD